MTRILDNQRTMTLKVEKFRAINSAQIDLDGITVIAGENGSGKSTLSKILYNTIKYSKKYELLIVKELNSELKEIASALFRSVQEIARYEQDDELKKHIYSSRSFRSPYLRSADIEGIKEYEKTLYLYLNTIRETLTGDGSGGQLVFEEFRDDLRKLKSMRTSRIRRILQDALFDNAKNDIDFEIVEFLELLKGKISIAFEKAYEYYNSRPIDLFAKELQILFHQSVAEKFDLIEYGFPITDWHENRFNDTNWIKNSIYVDTPMAINDDNYPMERYSMDRYWDELNSELRIGKAGHKDYYGFDDINSIIDGEVYYDDDTLFADGFKYKRNDGRVFNIDDCATGIKAFGILQLLLSNGKLTKDTLLIVDEPEAHLHPQWIVEYARIIVRLNKQIGVKFFIATHNPDMVSAIKYISEKEKVSERVNFYLAEKNKDDYTYNYKALKNDIEDIFESFNIAIERINQYGGQDA